ncbi:MAG: hypothetical protein AB1696_25040 [Planctomycetota bacterium]
MRRKECDLCGVEFDADRWQRRCPVCRENTARRGEGIGTSTGETTRRNCLKCGRPFPSVSRANRLCRACNYENDLFRLQVPRIRNRNRKLFPLAEDRALLRDLQRCELVEE